eukprot:CAMPEP_0183462974 /NCGR_PEP_ID=MMETSP0370-20130417/142701_1 /TAXON_ID=268820 /ORGANISM="Peridinium aciculiferum, Strain PAER-2" /LENGTH=97 /DNA_ID=CAMNT_0025655047 /DNA_START=144 /DNA_END=434 /DNA_ORIENTATION=-
MTSKTGAPARWVRTLDGAPPCDCARFASASPTITVSTPPAKPLSMPFRTRPGKSPCAEPSSRTPRAFTVRAASTSGSRPISSTTMTSGVWFCTASIM